MMTSYPVKGYELIVDSSGGGYCYREIRREADNVVIWSAEPRNRFTDAWADYRCWKLLAKLKDESEVSQ